MIFWHFYKVSNLYLHQSYLKSPLPVKLAWKKCKKSFFNIEKIKKYRKCPALHIKSLILKIFKSLFIKIMFNCYSVVLTCFQRLGHRCCTRQALKAWPPWQAPSSSLTPSSSSAPWLVKDKTFELSHWSRTRKEVSHWWRTTFCSSLDWWRTKLLSCPIGGRHKIGTLPLVEDKTLELSHWWRTKFLTFPSVGDKTLELSWLVKDKFWNSPIGGGQNF